MSAEDAGLPDAGERRLDDAPVGYLSTLADGQITSCNATFARWLGVSPEQLVGHPFAELLGPGERVVWLTHHVPRLAATGRLDAVSVDVARADGSTLSVLVTAVTVPGDTGARPDVWMTLLDGSERRSYERELLAARVAAERAEWRMRALQDLTETCATALTEEALLTAGVEAVAAGVEASVVRLWLPDAAARGVEDELVVGARYGGGSEGDDRDPRWRALVEEAWRQGVQAVASASLPALAIRSAIRFDHAAEPLGVLEVVVADTWRGRPGDLDVLAAMAPVLGQALVRVRLQERLHRLAMHDALTGLPNRVLWTESARSALARAARSGQPLTVMVIDLDGFKAVNDTRGHRAGDRILMGCAERILRAVRDGDVVSRLGGDEFVVLLEDTDEAAAQEIGRRIRAEITRPWQIDGAAVRIGASIGISVGRPPFASDALSAIFDVADAAMYADKRAARPDAPQELPAT